MIIINNDGGQGPTSRSSVPRITAGKIEVSLGHDLSQLERLKIKSNFYICI